MKKHKVQVHELMSIPNKGKKDIYNLTTEMCNQFKDFILKQSRKDVSRILVSLNNYLAYRHGEFGYRDCSWLTPGMVVLVDTGFDSFDMEVAFTRAALILKIWYGKMLILPLSKNLGLETGHINEHLVNVGSLNNLDYYSVGFVSDIHFCNCNRAIKVLDQIPTDSPTFKRIYNTVLEMLEDDDAVK